MIESKWKFVLLFALMGLLTSNVASALSQKDQNGVLIYDDENKTQLTSHETFNDGLRMFASLLVVLALIVGFIFLLKKMPIYKNLMRNAKQPISVVHNFSLGHRRSVCVLKVADEMLILGLTNTNISILSKMNVDEYYSSEFFEDVDPDNQNSLGNQNFFNQLKKLINKRPD